MKLYISDISVFALIIFYLPLVIWLWRKIIKMPVTITKKIVLSVLFFIIAYLIPLGDVTFNSIAMAKACPTAGLKIYKTVEVDGYLGLAHRDDLKRSQYHFLEGRAPGGKVVRYEKQSDGTIVTTKLDKPTAEYEVLYPSDHGKSNGLLLKEFDQKTRTQKSRRVIRNRITGEVLAEWLFVSGSAGWLDHALLYSWAGTGGGLLSCTHGSDFSIWPGSVLLPKTNY